MVRTLVAQVMTTPVTTATEAMPFRDIVALLHARDIGAVPVISMSGQVLGVVSRADLAAKAARSDGPARKLRLASRSGRREHRLAQARTAAELMTSPAVTTTPRAGIEQAARLMRQHRIGRLLVTDPLTGRLTGIVTRSDLLRVYLRPADDIRAEIEAQVFPLAGVQPGSLSVTVRNGIASIAGRLERRSAIASLVRNIRNIEGVVGIDDNIEYDIDDRHIILPS